MSPLSAAAEGQMSPTPGRTLSLPWSLQKSLAGTWGGAVPGPSWAPFPPRGQPRPHAHSAHGPCPPAAGARELGRDKVPTPPTPAGQSPSLAVTISPEWSPVLSPCPFPVQASVPRSPADPRSQQKAGARALSLLRTATDSQVGQMLTGTAEPCSQPLEGPRPHAPTRPAAPSAPSILHP